jgi:hypothetical protein
MRPFRSLCNAAVSVAVLTIVSAAVIPAASQAHAQEYPTKPVTISRTRLQAARRMPCCG